MSDIIVTPPKTSGPKARKARDWAHRLALVFAVLLPIWFMVAALGSKFGLWSWQTGLGTLSRDIGMKLIFATLGLGIIAALVTAFVKPRKGWWIVILALIVPLGLMAKGASVKKTAESLPFIHDITTDTQNPPTFSDVIKAERAKVEGVNTLDYIGKKARTKDGEKLVSVLQVKAYPAVRTLVLSEQPDVVFGEALAAVKSLGWEIAVSDPDKGRIDATDTTFWYGFKDDVTVRIKAGEGGETLVDVRSVSRVGGSDLGANAARVEKLLSRLAK